MSRITSLNCFGSEHEHAIHASFACSGVNKGRTRRWRKGWLVLHWNCCWLWISPALRRKTVTLRFEGVCPEFLPSWLYFESFSIVRAIVLSTEKLRWLKDVSYKVHERVAIIVEETIEIGRSELIRELENGLLSQRQVVPLCPIWGASPVCWVWFDFMYDSLHNVLRL